MKIVSSRRFALWWQLAMDWFQRQFAAIAASIDFTPVEEKLDDVKSDVADVKEAVENIDFSTLATEENATANKNAVIAAIIAAFPTVSQIQNGLAKTNELPTIPTDYAKEATVAKQGTDPTATNTVIRDLVLQQGILYAQEYAAAINEIAGDWSESESES